MDLKPSDVSADWNKTPGQQDLVTITVRGRVKVKSANPNVKDGEPVTYIVIEPEKR